MYLLARTVTAVSSVHAKLKGPAHTMRSIDDRYLCRVQEFRESLRIIDQVSCPMHRQPVTADLGVCSA